MYLYILYMHKRRFTCPKGSMDVKYYYKLSRSGSCPHIPSNPLCSGDSLCSARCPLLSPWKWLHHTQSVSLHVGSRGGSRYGSENVPFPMNLTPLVLRSQMCLSRGPPPIHQLSNWSCMALCFSSLCLCSTGSLFFFCLICLSLSVWSYLVVQWIIFFSFC